MASYVAIFNMTSSPLLSRLNGPSLPQLDPMPPPPEQPTPLLVKRVQGVPSTPVFGNSNCFAAVFPGSDPPGLNYTVPIEIDPSKFPLNENMQLYVTFGGLVLSQDGRVVSWDVPPPVPTSSD
jgi:hypothetical protein